MIYSIDRSVNQAMWPMHVLCIFGFPRGRSCDHMSHRSLPWSLLSILPKQILKFDFVKENSFVLSKHIFSKFDNRGVRFCKAEGAVVAGCPFCASWGSCVADRPIGRSGDVTNAHAVHLRFPVCPIDRSHVAQKSSGGLPVDFAQKCSNIRFCEKEFVRFQQAYMFEVWQSRWTVS